MFNYLKGYTKCNKAAKDILRLFDRVLTAISPPGGEIFTQIRTCDHQVKIAGKIRQKDREILSYYISKSS